MEGEAQQVAAWMKSLPEFRSTILAETPFAALSDIIPKSGERAIWGTDVAKSPLTFNELRKFVGELDLCRFGLRRSDTLCTAIPNGPEAAVCFLAFMNQCVFAPLNPVLTVAEIEFELHDLPAAAMIVLEGDQGAAAVEECCVANKVPVIHMAPSPSVAGTFRLSGPQASCPPAAVTKASDLALVLHTSGTTKKPKIVPLTHHNLGHGIQFVAKTLRRTREAGHVCLNVMPLFHIHGLIANVGVSLYSHTQVVCSAFRGGVGFLEDLVDPQGTYPSPTWYSAVPTMHEAILLEAESQGEQLKHHLTLMRNCSAALLPPVAKRFLAAFGASSPAPFTVVPTYAMTESFPICSNPPHLQIKLATVGPALGPSIRILQGHPNDTELPAGTEGEVCVAGECVTSGYLMREHMSADPNVEAFSRVDSSVGRMLRTGDKGFLDEDGYLQLVGRFKEIINCGGEKISPLEIEDQLLSVRAVQTCVCFATPAELYGEVVGVACVVKSGEDPPTVDELRQGVSSVSARFKPSVLVLLDAIPKGPTGKPKRIGLAKQLKIPPLMQADALPTYVVRGAGDELGPLRAIVKKRWSDERVVAPVWSFPLHIRLEMSPDLGSFFRTRHELTIEDPECHEVKLVITAFDCGCPVPLDFPISRADALEAIDDVKYRTVEYGLKWTSRMAIDIDPTGKLSAEDFAADLFVSDGTLEFEHTWRTGCHDSPPGRMMRLLKVFECGHGFEAEPPKVDTGASSGAQSNMPVAAC